MEKALYEANIVKSDVIATKTGIKLKLRLLDDHFYDDVHFKGSVEELVDTIEKGKMLYIIKINGDQIFVNSKLIVDFVLS